MTEVFIKRIYEPADQTDGFRILVDRVWPRGISKETAQITNWLKDIAPSSELRKWFCHKPELFNEFKQRYLGELRQDEKKIEIMEDLIELAQKGTITLLYGAKDREHNQAVVLSEELKRQIEDK
jgi:uncharacterized protein YeaO (DUF488 family)